MSVPLQICNGTVHMWYNFYNLQHLIKLHFCVWCAKCAKNLTFGTFSTSAAGALTNPFLRNKFIQKLKLEKNNKKSSPSTLIFSSRPRSFFYFYFFSMTHLFLLFNFSLFFFFEFPISLIPNLMYTNPPPK